MAGPGSRAGHDRAAPTDGSGVAAAVAGGGEGNQDGARGVGTCDKITGKGEPNPWERGRGR